MASHKENGISQAAYHHLANKPLLSDRLRRWRRQSSTLYARDAPLMKYPDGNEVRIGDRVKLSNREGGVVVFSVDADEYSDDYPKGDWAYLGKGIMVKTDAGTLIHYEDNSGNEITKENGWVRT